MARGVYSSANHFVYTGAPVTATPLTLACWVYPSAVANINTYLSLCYTGGAGAFLDGFNIRNVASSGLVRAEVGDGTNTSGGNAGAVTTGAWNHVAGVFTSSTSRTPYLNGAVGTENTTSRTPSAAADKTVIGIRYFQNNAKDSAANESQIAEATIWNVALTAAEILQLAAGYSPLFVRPASLMAYYPLVRGDASGDEPDVWRGLKMVEQGTVVVQSHPRVFYPAPRLFSKYIPAAGGPVIPVFMNQYRQRSN